MSAVSTFLIMPPSDLNDEVVGNAVYLEDRLASEFPGYRFEIIDLRKIKGVDKGQPVLFGDGMSFVAIPLMGTTSAGPNDGFYMADPPPRTLVEDIMKFCEGFSFDQARRHVA